MRKWLLRFFSFLLILSVFFLSAFWIWLYVYKPVMVGKVEEALKQYSRADVQYKWANVSFLKNWGRITLSFYQVHMTLPAREAKVGAKTVAHMGQVHFLMDISNLWNGTYQIGAIGVDEADLHPDFWQIWHFPSDKRQRTCLHIDALCLQNVRLRILNSVFSENKEAGILDFSEMNIKFKDVNDLHNFRVQARLQKAQYLVDKRVMWEIERGELSTELAYTPHKKMWQINETNVRIREGDFVLRGNCIWAENAPAKVDLKFRGKEGNLQNILAFLPTHYYEDFGGYKAKGKIDFQGSLVGEMGKGKMPALEVDFGGENIEIISPYTLQQRIMEFSFVGKLNSNILRISEMAGKLGTQKFKGAFMLSNWAKPHIVADLEAGFDLGVLHEFYPLRRWQSLKGLAGVSLHLDADIQELLKNSAEPKKITALGDIELINVTAKLQDSQELYEKLNAKIFLQHDFATIQQFVVSWGRNDVHLKGRVQNWVAYVFDMEQTLVFRGEARSRFLNVEEFTKMPLACPMTLQAEIRVWVDSLSFRKVKAKNMQADVSIKDKTLKTGNLTMQMAGGTFNFLGILNTQKANFITLDGRIMLQNTQANQILEAFGNFGQKVLQDKNIVGIFDADMRSSFVFDKNLQMKFPQTVFDAEIVLKNGEFADAQILHDLAQKVQLPEVKKMPFQEIHALLQMRNQTLFVPECELLGNQNLGFMGKVTPEKGLDFKVRLQPKRNLVYHVNWTGAADSFVLAFPPESEQPNLEVNWQREKLAYLKIFKRQNTHEHIKIDTMRIGF